MTEPKRFALVPIVFTAVFTVLSHTGCSREKTAVEHFKETQANTVTPHGKIKMDSVQQSSDNKVQYETESGKKMEVTVDKKANGFKYSDSQPIKQK